jgi:hypothetical protein
MPAATARQFADRHVPRCGVMCKLSIFLHVSIDTLEALLTPLNAQLRLQQAVSSVPGVAAGRWRVACHVTARRNGDPTLYRSRDWPAGD